MAQNFVQTGDVVDFPAPYAVASGAGAQIGQCFGVALNTLANGVTGPFQVVGVFDLAKTASQVFTPGALAYWDNAAKSVTTVNTSNLRIGVATRAAASGDTTVRVRLSGTPAPAGA
jgi:predicted RecA/RadA family phage recombinase